MFQKNNLSLIIIIFILVILFTYLFYINNKNTPEKKEVINKNPPEIGSNQKIRKLAVSGTFYNNNYDQLEKEIDVLLNKQDKIKKSEKPRIIIVPHAGLIYSGDIQASAYKQIQGEFYDKIILLGVGHSHSGEYAAVISEGSWETPFGNLGIDTNLANKLIDNKYIVEDEIPHLKEHSLEMQTIFLKKLLPNSNIVPILIGNPSDETIYSVSYKIATIFDENTLLVISTDFSHYPNYEDAIKVDSNTIDAILSGNYRVLEKAISENKDGKYTNLETSACGEKAVSIGLIISNLLSINNIEKIAYSNSGDVSGDISRVVGYTSIGFWSQDIRQLNFSYNAKKELFGFSKKILVDYYNKKIFPKYTFSSQEIYLPGGAFVTLKKNGELRGCIGTFEPNLTMGEIIKELTIASATKDSRFPPVTQEELKDIDIELSILSIPKKIDDFKKIEIGLHGVKININGKTGTFLPEVAVENNWDLVTFLENLCTQKMGLNKDCYKSTDSEIYIYTTDHFSKSDIID